MRVLALTRYGRLGSSSRVRFYQYFPYLQSHGLEIVNASFFDDEYVNNLYSGQSLSVKPVLLAYLNRLLELIKSSSFDLIWVEKEMLPWFPASFEFLLHKTNIPYVVDYDDAVFHRYGLHSSSLVRTLLGHKIDRVMRWSLLGMNISPKGLNKLERVKWNSYPAWWMSVVIDKNKHVVV